jgi:ribosomal protein S27AE
VRRAFCYCGEIEKRGKDKYMEKQGGIRMELKYCERCGGLFLRQAESARVYCVTCGPAMQEMAIGKKLPASARAAEELGGATCA